MLNCAYDKEFYTCIKVKQKGIPPLKKKCQSSILVAGLVCQ